MKNVGLQIFGVMTVALIGLQFSISSHRSGVDDLSSSIDSSSIEDSSQKLEFNNDVLRKIDAIVSIFENGTSSIQYGYIQRLNDGRGYTAGRAGFTTATGDLFDVVIRYIKLAPDSPLRAQFEKLIPVLKQLAEKESDDTSELSQLPALWATAAADDPRFVLAQDQIIDDLYRKPALEVCKQLNLRSALSFLVIYDTIIQHGGGEEEDSLSSLVAHTQKSVDEREFIRAFLKVRRADLLNPSNQKTVGEWRESVGRVDALKRLADENNWDLASPFTLRVWNLTFPL